MRIALGTALICCTIWCTGCSSTPAPDPCRALMDQARVGHQLYTATVTRLKDEIHTKGASRVKKETLGATNDLRAWFLEDVFGVKMAEVAGVKNLARFLAAKELPTSVHGCSGSGLDEIRGKAFIELNFLDQVIEEYKKPL